MPAPKLTVSLRAVATEMDLPNEAWTAFINKRTGELITVTDEESRAVEDDADDDSPAWQAEFLPKAREALTSDEFLPLPSKFDIDEYSIMRRFCEQVADTKTRESLLRAIRGSGAFGRFRALADHCGIIDQWYAFRDHAMEEIAAEWLEVNGIAYRRDGSSKDENDA